MKSHYLFIVGFFILLTSCDIELDTAPTVYDEFVEVVGVSIENRGSYYHNDETYSVGTYQIAVEYLLDNPYASQYAVNPVTTKKIVGIDVSYKDLSNDEPEENVTNYFVVDSDYRYETGLYMKVWNYTDLINSKENTDISDFRLVFTNMNELDYENFLIQPGEEVNARFRVLITLDDLSIIEDFVEVHLINQQNITN